MKANINTSSYKTWRARVRAFSETSQALQIELDLKLISI